MKKSAYDLSVYFARALPAAALIAACAAHAGPTDISNTPLSNSSTGSVLPNVMFILDNSSSMRHNDMPDDVLDSSTACKSCTATACNVAGSACVLPNSGSDYAWTDATPAKFLTPFYATQFNNLAYNPQVRYTPGVNSLGVSLGNSTPTAANTDPYLGGTTKNLTTTWTEVVWCDLATRTVADLTNSTYCKRNGIHTTPNPFVYKASAVANDADFSGGFPNTKFRFPMALKTNPHYFDITAREHCTDNTLARCTLSATPVTISGTAFLVPAPVRYCNSAANAAPTTAVSDTPPTTARCQANWIGSYDFPRLGNITRTDIVPATATYGNRPYRTDCTAPNCTYAQELQNFANWYTYYRTRVLLMKTVAGQAFTALDDRYRVGFVAINPNDSNYYLKIDKFTAAHKALWYDKFYKCPHQSGTPLKQALARVGRHFAGKQDGLNAVMIDDPVQNSCQQNFAILTTDGYYGSEPGVQIDGITDIGNQDNVADTTAPFYVTRGSGTFDGNLASSSSTLADVAMYYYKTDLRPTMANNVPTTDKDKAAHQHMVTFGLGMGLAGLMDYRSDYETASTGDFKKIKNGDPAPNCSWTTLKCDWPAPSSDPAKLDDLWHAAVNGRGLYFSAKDPGTLQAAFAGALAGIKIATGASAAASVSTPNITPTDNFIYSSTYRTMKWDGEVVAERIDTATGNVIPGVVWSARDQLDARVTINSDTRTIHTLDPLDATDKLKPFLYANLTAAEKAYFDNKCAALAQCPSLTSGQQNTVNNGTNFVNYLRGQTKKEDGVVFRDREHVLGDIVNAEPAHVGKPALSYSDAVVPDYSSFKAANASRQPVLYIAANDGMLHAFNAGTGAEMWAYVPPMVMPDLYKLADTNYAAAHRYFLDGSPAPMDVFLGGAWKTILVAGLNSGGRGYYALDVTDPNNPKGLWQVCSNAALCAVSDADMGLSFGEPIITKRPSDGKWVVIVTSGYNNVTPGDGKGWVYVLDAATGAILSKVSTGIGDTTTPSGFARISAFATDFRVNNTTTFVYGGDLLGNVFRYDTAANTMQRIAQLFDGSSPPRPQSVTTRPEITRNGGFNTVFVGTGRLLGTSDLQDPATLVPSQNFAYQQTVYGIKDTGTDLGNLRLTGNLVQQTLTVIDPVTRSSSTNAVDWNTKNGWYVDLNPLNGSPGERVNIEPQLVLGTLVVIANVPGQDACTIGGSSWVYQFNYQSGQYLLTSPSSAVATKLGNSLTMGIVLVRLPSGQLKAIATDAAGNKTSFGVNIGAASASGKRTSWRELIL